MEMRVSAPQGPDWAVRCEKWPSGNDRVALATGGFCIKARAKQRPAHAKAGTWACGTRETLPAARAAGPSIRLRL
jgi:hypothetical protein